MRNIFKPTAYAALFVDDTAWYSHRELQCRREQLCSFPAACNPVMGSAPANFQMIPRWIMSYGRSEYRRYQ